MDNKHGNPIRVAFRKLFQNKLATLCFIILILEIILVALAPVIAPYGYDEQDPSIRLRPGFWAQWTGAQAGMRKMARIPVTQPVTQASRQS